MAKYEPGDIVTFYFVVKTVDGQKIIQGWTDNKEIAKFYMEFHKCDNFKLKSLTDTIEAINKVAEENWNDEIKLFNIITRNRNKRKNQEAYNTICIPATETELKFIREESVTYMASRINYSLINDALPYLKNKYQKDLQSIFLPDIIRKTIYSQNTKFSQLIEYDQLLILYKSFPENFGI